MGHDRAHDGLVTEKTLARMRHRTRKRFTKKALRWFARREPELEAFVEAEIEAIAGRLALTGAPPFVAQGVARDVTLLAARIYLALDLGHGELWKKEVLGGLEEPAAPPAAPRGLPGIRRCPRRSEKPPETGKVGPDEA